MANETSEGDEEGMDGETGSGEDDEVDGCSNDGSRMREMDKKQSRTAHVEEVEDEGEVVAPRVGRSVAVEWPYGAVDGTETASAENGAAASILYNRIVEESQSAQPHDDVPILSPHFIFELSLDTTVRDEPETHVNTNLSDSAQSQSLLSLYNGSSAHESVTRKARLSGSAQSRLTLALNDASCFAYKPVARKVRPVATTLPEDMRVARVAHPNPLEHLPELPTDPPEFEPGVRLTQERHDNMEWNRDEFLTDTEVRLVKWMVRSHEMAIAWDETEKGVFDPEYYPPVLIPTIEHIPWMFRNIPIPNGIHDKVIQIIKEKIASGIYEPSSASYRSRWFCVVKKDGKSLRLVHDLQPLNGVSIKDAAVPPFVDQLGEAYAGRACYSSYDLYVAFDQRKLDVRSRDMTSFQTPLGTFRLTSIPMGYTNSMQILHNDVRFMLRDFIPDITEPFVDDIMTKGPKTRYEKEDGSYETIPENPQIRRFIWEHLNADNKVLQTLKAHGVTISGSKMVVASPIGMIVGHKCTYEGRIPDKSKIEKLLNWPVPRTVTELRSFLGTAGVFRPFVKDYTLKIRPLTQLTRKGVIFDFGEEAINAMMDVQEAIQDCPGLRPIDYDSNRPVILGVDSSYIGFGYVLSQIGKDGKRYPNRFGSGTWNLRESHYSQSKVELFGLYRSLRAVRIYIFGVIKLVVEVDAKYIRGMINNPDVQPNATINRWIAGILLFHFELVHVPGTGHKGPDGMSRRGRAEGDAEESQDDLDESLEGGYAFYFDRQVPWDERTEVIEILVAETSAGVAGQTAEVFPISDRREKQEKRLLQVQELLETLKRAEGMSDGEFKVLIRYATEYFVRDGKLWKRNPDGVHRLVPNRSKRAGLISVAHDELGHKGVFPVSEMLRRRFWWPGLEEHVKWHIRTCHECQMRQFKIQHIPPVVSTPAPLFQKVYIDTMLMPAAGGYKYIIHARDSLTSWPEWRALTSETSQTVRKFIFEEIFCRWGPVYELVTDNGKPFIAEAVQELYDTYKVRNIRISAYNSQANGAVERRHRDVREAIMKMVKGNESKWPSMLPAVFWAERITIQKGTGMSPYEMAHGVEPILPFDLEEATFLVNPPTAKVTTAELLAARARQLMKRPADLKRAHERILKARNAGALEFEKKYKRTIYKGEFKPGALVLVRNTRVEKELNRKTKPRYLGPYVVLRRTAGGSYILAETDGAVARTRFAAFRVIPYFARTDIGISPEVLTEMTKAQLDNIAKELEDEPDTEAEEAEEGSEEETGAQSRDEESSADEH